MNEINQLLSGSENHRAVGNLESLTLTPAPEGDFQSIARRVKGMEPKLRRLGYSVKFHKDADSPLEDACDEIFIWKDQ